jgi:hypothetical protein
MLITFLGFKVYDFYECETADEQVYRNNPCPIQEQRTT